LSWRDIKVKYKQATLGILWAVIRPVLTMIVFTFVFGRLGHFKVEGIAPYAIMVFAGLLPWQFFANALSESSGSLVDNEKLITKVYFPRLIIPASSVITSSIDFFISFIILLVLCLFYQYTPPLQIMLIPLFWILAFAASFGPGLYLTALNVKYRDFRYIIPFIVQFGLYISPVGFSSNIVPNEWRWAYALNPMVGVIDCFRWCVVQGAPNPFLGYPFYISLVVIIFFVWLAIHQFRKMEKYFADHI
jgi:lipopolysaccharide transport system permease protein